MPAVIPWDVLSICLYRLGMSHSRCMCMSSRMPPSSSFLADLSNALCSVALKTCPQEMLRYPSLTWLTVAAGSIFLLACAKVAAIACRSSLSSTALSQAMQIPRVSLPLPARLCFSSLSPLPLPPLWYLLIKRLHRKSDQSLPPFPKTSITCDASLSTPSFLFSLFLLILLTSRPASTSLKNTLTLSISILMASYGLRSSSLHSTCSKPMS